MPLREWDRELISAVGQEPSIFPELHEQGTRLGFVSGHRGLNGIEIVAVASHNTASAVAGTPFDGKRRAAFISAGRGHWLESK
jgi:rhamnulokinase